MSASIHCVREATFRLTAACLGLWLGIVPSHAAGRSADFERAFIAAEREAGKEEALKQWKVLLEAMSRQDPEDIPAFVSADLVQRIIVDLYVQLATSEEKALEAYDYVNQIADREIRLWGLVHVLDRITRRGDLGSHPKLLAVAQDSINSVFFDAIGIASEARQLLYYALAFVMTSEEGRNVYPEKEMQRVHELIVHVHHPEHRLDLMRRFGALAGTFPPSLYPPTFQRLYQSFAKGHPEAETLLALHGEAVKKNHFNAALYALLAIPHEKTRTSRLKEYFQALMKQDEISRARRVAEQTDNASACVDMWSGLVREYLYYGYDLKARTAQDRALACAGTMEEPGRQKALLLIEEREASGRKKHGQYTEPDPQKKKSLEDRIDEVLAKKGIAPAAALVKAQSDTRLRVDAFHYLARRQAGALDRYGLLREGASYQKVTDPVSYFLDRRENKSALTIVEVKAQEDALRKRYGRDPSNVMVYESKPSRLGEAIHYNALPKQAEISGEVIRARMPLPEGGRVVLSHYEDNIFNSSFIRLFGNSGFVLSQQSSAPLVITIENGVVDVMTIYDELVDLGNARCLERKNSIYTLRCPLIVGTNAALVMSGDNISEMRLSTRSGSYLLNANVIFMSDIILAGWDDDRNQPMWMDYEDRYYFRPFFTSWNRSYSYIGNSEIIALGYDHGKSYGISFSSGPNNWENLGEIDSPDRPTGIIVDNSFRNMMFGFYSFEAYNVVLVGNEYVDNIVYGADPHDRSTYLVIAYNTLYGTAKKHGIILSREVGKSLIAGNLSFANRGSGIMLDRESNETLIYANTAFENEQEGVSLFESNCNIIASNMLFSNQGSGIRLRNSRDVGIYYNQVAYNNHGITAYTLILEEDPDHSHRDFVLDPYADITAFAAVGNMIQENRTGIYAEEVDGMFLKRNVFMKQAPSLFRGDWFATRMQDIMQMDPQEKGAVISRICPTTRRPPPPHSCMFRENATLLGDGMDLLTARLSLPQCREAQESIHTAKKEASG